MLKGENLLMQKAYPDADALFARLEKDVPEKEAMRLALRRAQCAYYAGDFKTAVARLALVDQPGPPATDPFRIDGVFLRADAQLQQNDFADAARGFADVLKLENTHAEEATYKLAIAQLGLKERQAAGETLAGLSKGKLDNAWVQRAWFEIGQMAYEDRKLDVAGQALAKLLAAAPAEAVAAPAEYLAARIELETGKPDAAAARLAALREKYPQHPLAEDAMYLRGTALKEAGKPQEAVAQFAAYLAAYPKGRFVTEARHQDAASLTASGNPGEAVKILTQLAAAKETRSDAVLYNLAWAQRTAGDAPGAAATYEAMVKEFPTSARLNAARVELADLDAQADRAAEAVALLTAALKDANIDPHSRAVALYRLGACQMKLGEASKAAAAFDAFAAENPQDPLVPAALCEAGAAYARAEQFDTANARLNRVAAEFPKSDSAKLAALRLGDVQNQRQQYEAAAATFEAWLKAHPNDPLAPLAEFGVGWSLENRARYGPARERYNRVLALDKGATAARAQFQIGETYFKEKLYESAAKELLTVDILYRYPEWSAPALYEAGCAFEALGEMPKARAQWEDCVKKYPQSTVAGMARKKLQG